jgi:uncharacterized protein YecE (DUF72 family)
MSGSAQNPIRVGPAGWNYKDWYGFFYPLKPDQQFKELEFLANYFDTAEINSTFYHPANVFMVRAWVRKVAHNPNFKFTAKLWSRFTHERNPFGSAEIGQFTQGIDTLAEAGKLGAVLCQFPWSYKNDKSGKDWLNNVLEAFKDYPLVVEVRHASWDTDEFYNYLDNKNVGFATIDQPVIGKSLSFKPVRTGPIGYVRMHGRNYKAWFSKKGDRSGQTSESARYDYLYKEKEISEIVEKVKKVADGSAETYVVQNNHPRGQAIANAIQIRTSLGEVIRSLPDSMFLHYPFLRNNITRLFTES